MKLFSWNIRQGGGSRVVKIVSAIRSADPDIICLSEFRNNLRGHRLRAELLSLGYRYQVVSAAPAEVNSVLLASRLPGDGRLLPAADPEYFHGIVAMDFSLFSVYSVYFPHKKKHQLLQYMIDVELQRDHPSIVLGDYNTGINYVDQKGNSFWYTDQMEKLSEIGYVDAWRLKQGDRKDYSWYSHQGNGYRYDHIYLQQDLVPIVQQCDYLHGVREEGWSDHSAMYLVLGPGA